MAVVVTYTGISGSPGSIPFKDFVNMTVDTHKDQLLKDLPTYTANRLVFFTKKDKRGIGPEQQDFRRNNRMEIFSYRYIPIEEISNWFSLVTPEEAMRKINSVLKDRDRKAEFVSHDTASKKITVAHDGTGELCQIIPSSFEDCVTMISAHQQYLIEKALPDYYVRMNEGWMPNFEDKQLIDKLHSEWKANGGQKFGDIADLPPTERIEIVTCVARVLDNSHPKISKTYEIVRERRNDESSKVLNLKELDVDIGGDSFHMGSAIASNIRPTNSNTWVDGDGR